MGLTPVNVEGFSGLRLDLDPEEAGLTQATDLLNVDLDREGRVRSRDGYTKATSSAGATRYDSVFPVAGAAVAASSTTGLAGTGADDSSTGTVAWSNPGNITALDGTYATAALSSAIVSHYIKGTNFGLSVPGTATILGVLVVIKRKCASSAVIDSSVRLVKGGAIVGNNEASPSTWPTSNSSAIYGSASDLWGTSLTPADVNASTFGVVLAATGTGVADTASVDLVFIQIYYQTLGNVIVAGAAGSRLDIIASDGTVAATTATASDTRQSYVGFGSPTTSAVYIANSGVTMRKLVGTTFSQPAGMPKAKFVGLQTPDNRLVAANIGTVPTGSNATASTSLVVFSDAGYPEVWNDTGDGLRSANGNHYVYLTPGDNEDIKGVVTWRNQTFIFKGSQFFVFYGNSTDSTGQPVFNYRAVTGAGLVTDQAACASPDGVYFLDRRGIYYTTGGPAQRVSTPIDPLFTGAAVPFFVPGSINPSAFGQVTMTWMGGRLFIGVPLGVSTVNSHTIVHDPVRQTWVVWDIPMGAMISSLAQPALLYFTYASGTNNIGAYLPNGYTLDDATVITSRYRSGFTDLGAAGVEKTVRQTELNGQGTVSLGWSRDFGAITSTSTANVTLGTAPATARGLHRLSQNGEQLGYQINSVTGGAWMLNRVTPMVRPFRQPGDKTS